MEHGRTFRNNTFMKWTSVIIIFFYLKSSAQTIDTLQNVHATASAFNIETFSGTTNEGHPYIYGVKLNATPANVYSDATLVKIDLTNKHITEKTMVNNPQGVGWSSIKTFDGTVLSTRGTGLREVYEMGFKIADSISIRSLGNSGICNDAFAYSYSYGRDSSVCIGNSSSNCDNTGMAIKRRGVDTLQKIAGCDSSLDYTYHVVLDTDNWIYEQCGQSVYRIWAKNIITGQKKLLLQRDDVFMDLSAYTNGVFAYRSDQNKTYLLTGGDTVLVASNYNKGTLITITETRRFTDQHNSLPYVAYNYDSPKEKLFYINSTQLFITPQNSPPDSVDYSGGVIPKAIVLLTPDNTTPNILRYVGNPYGFVEEYFISQDSTARYGYPAMNVYSQYQLNDSIVYLAGYPSGVIAKWNRNHVWTAETGSATAIYNPMSTTTNPKLIGYGASVAGMDHAQLLTLVNNRYLCFTGNNIRDKFTSSVGCVDITNDSIYGYDDDQMISKAFSDITAWNDKLVYSTNDGNGGTAYIYIYNPTTNLMTDSISFGYHNYGHIFTIGDLLYGVAQDTSNADHNLDYTIFYKVNLSTKQLTYYQRKRGTLYEFNYMPDAYLGLNFMLITVPGAIPVTQPPPVDFFLTRVIQDFNYSYDYNTHYYGVSNKVIKISGVTSSVVNANEKYGISTILSRWLH